MFLTSNKLAIGPTGGGPSLVVGKESASLVSNGQSIGRAPDTGILATGKSRDGITNSIIGASKDGGCGHSVAAFVLHQG